MAVFIKDFGEINIDADLVVGAEEDPSGDPRSISPVNGCVCCQIRDDLMETVAELPNRPDQVEYVLLEGSGVAEPPGMADTFSSKIWLSKHCSL